MEIKELKEPLTFSFDGVIIHSEKMAMKCDKCNRNLWHDFRFDAHFCPHCNEWKSTPSDMHLALHENRNIYYDWELAKFPLVKEIPNRPLDRPKGVNPGNNYLWQIVAGSVKIEVD